MPRLPLLSLAFGFATVLIGCGSDAHEEAPAVGSGAAIAQAPPNAIGADVPRPTVAKPISTAPKPIHKTPTKQAPNLGDDPLAPDPAPGPAGKGTEL